jgi:hypothetical protein
MAKSDNKTTWTGQDVMEFLDQLQEKKRADALKLIALMEKASGWPAKMWGPSIVGFGKYHYRYESGREGDAPVVGFSPGKAAISLYLLYDSEERDEMLARLGKHRASKACTYINKLADVDMDVIKEMVHATINHIRKDYTVQ